MSDTYGFSDIEAIVDGKLYMCHGEINYEYEPGEPDEKWGYFGATPGYASQATGLSVQCLDEVSHEDEKGKLHTDMNEFPLDQIKAEIVSWFQENNTIITQYHEEE